ncbi:MAG TPA: (d)CMP kinase [Candidatus Krumholzibacteria bacterium]|nr:(d)CMP kinase [Candidatus Krumholzibacteria bacterium]
MSAGIGARFAFRPGERESLAARAAARAAALRRLVIAIDGPAGAGKSTTARGVAARLGLRYLDTGALYRAVTLAAQRSGVEPGDEAALAALVQTARLRVESDAAGQRVYLGDEDVSGAIRHPQVTAMVSQVSAWPAVRAAMLDLQRRLAAAGGTVMEGRDIGSVVLPQADLKIFLTADVAARAARRQEEEAARGNARPRQAVEEEIEARDRADTTRSSAPLRRTAGAIELDTTELGIEAQLDAVVALALRCVEAGTTTAAAHTFVPEDWAQPGYRPFRRRRFRCAHVLISSFFRAACGLRCEVHPASRLTGSALVACNHISGLDPPLAGASVPFESCFVAKSELFRSGAFGWLIGLFNAFPIQRGTADYAALDRAVALLQAGENVLMFPEGTRQKPGRLGRSRWGFGYVARRAGRPIVPVFVRGSRDRRPRFLRRQPLEVWVGEPFVLGALSDDPDGYAQAGALAMEHIAGLMLRSAARVPLAGLELPGIFAPAGPEP